MIVATIERSDIFLTGDTASSVLLPGEESGTLHATETDKLISP